MVVVRLNGTINKLYTNPCTDAIKGREGRITDTLLTAGSFWTEGRKGWGEMTRTGTLYSKDFSTVYSFYIENTLMQSTGTASWYSRV